MVHALDWFLCCVVGCCSAAGGGGVGVMVLSPVEGEVGMISLFRRTLLFPPLPTIHSSVVCTLKWSLAWGPNARLPSWTECEVDGPPVLLWISLCVCLTASSSSDQDPWEFSSECL